MVNVHYIFADGSSVDMPMVMAEEMTQLWLLSFGDPGSAEDSEYGPLTSDICTRRGYGEYELREPDRAVYWDWICIEITDGGKGWFRLQDGMDYSDYFSGLYFAG